MNNIRITESDIQHLKELIGNNKIFTDKTDTEAYSYDEAPMAKRFYPQVVVKPTGVSDVAAILSYANKRKIPVVPRGAGTGVSGGAIATYGGIVLSLEKMNHIIEIDEKNFVAVVEPGVTLADLRTELEKYNLVYPLYPGELTATLGGNVSTNAGGMNAVKYGVTRHHVMGLEMVLADGNIIQSGGKFVKYTTAYDLTQLIIGSEGTLAVITKIMLKLSSPKPNREVLLVPFTGLQNAIDAVPEILRLPTIPVGLEFMEKDIIDIVENFTGKEMPHHDYPAFLMIIMEGETPEIIMNYFRQVNEICRKHEAIEGLIPGSERATRNLLQMREKFYPAIKAYSNMEIIDAVVPRSEIARFMNQVRKLSGQYNMQVIGYGHAGDGNVHIHVLRSDMNDDVWHNTFPLLMKAIFKSAISFGGAISGEHGIGYAKKEYLPLQFSKEYLKTLRSIKTALDPNNILNPGKIFDLDH